MRDEKGLDHKILCVPLHDPQWNHLSKLDDAPPHLLKEIEHFFSIYKDLEQKTTSVEGWEDVQAAWAVINEARQKFSAAHSI